MARPNRARAAALAATLMASLGAAPAPDDAGTGAEDAASESADSGAPAVEAGSASEAAAPAPAQAVAPPALARPDAATGPLQDAPTLHSAFVHLYADYPGAVLELRSYVDDTEWKEACRAPCDRTLRVEGMEARVLAAGMTTSNVFRVDPGRGTANLKVEGGSAGSRTLGMVGFAGGIPVALAGMGLWGYGKIDDRSGLRTAGIVTMGVAAVMILGSLPFLGAGSTKVRDGKGKVIASSFAPPRF